MVAYAFNGDSERLQRKFDRAARAVEDRRIASKWALDRAKETLFGKAPEMRQPRIDAAVHRLLDEIEKNWPFADEAKVLLFRAKLAGKVVNASTTARYSFLVAPPEKRPGTNVLNIDFATERKGMPASRKAKLAARSLKDAARRANMKGSHEEKPLHGKGGGKNKKK